MENANSWSYSSLSSDQIHMTPAISAYVAGVSLPFSNTAVPNAPFRWFAWKRIIHCCWVQWYHHKFWQNWSTRARHVSDPLKTPLMDFSKWVPRTLHTVRWELDKNTPDADRATNIQLHAQQSNQQSTEWSLTPQQRNLGRKNNGKDKKDGKV